MLDETAVLYQGSAFIDYFVVKRLGHIARLKIFGRLLLTRTRRCAAGHSARSRPGETILDLCAAPGGKTTFIGELTGNQGSVVAVDRYETKLDLIRKGCVRLGIIDVSFAVADAREFTAEPADKVLVDAPCSGLGTLRKKPDIKWKRQPEDIVNLCALQREILDNAATLVKAGGVLVYSTCTTEPEENRMQVEGFLQRHDDFIVEDASAFVARAVGTPAGHSETFPHVHHMDGSFAAR